MRASAFLIAILALPALPPAVRAADPAQAARLIVEQTNALRRKEGLPAVSPDAHLEEAARYFAAYMADNDRYGHTADGKRPAERARRFGYDYCLVTENIAYQYRSDGFGDEALATATVRGWLDSRGHRANMVDPAARHIAVAVAQSARTARYYAVQMFGRPRSAMIEFRVRNEARGALRYRVGERDFTLPPGAARVHTQCGIERLAFARGPSFRPAGGERFVAVQSTGRVEVRRE